MGAIAPSKMPGAKKKARRDDTDFDEYAKGGKVKKMAEGDLVDEANVKPTYAVLDPKYKAAGARLSAKKSLGKDTDIEAYMDVDAAKARDQALKVSPSKVGVMFNKRFAKGGESKVNEAGVYTKPGMRKSLFESIKSRAVQGTGAGQWSARKAQLLAKQYKAKGGSYK